MAEVRVKQQEALRLEDHVVSWKEKVKASKVRDMERIQTLEKELEVLEAEAVAVFRCVAAFGGVPASELPAEKVPKEWVSVVAVYLADVQRSVDSFCEEWGVGGKDRRLVALMEAASAAAAKDKGSLKEAVSARQRCEAEVATLKEAEAVLIARCSEADSRIAALESDAVKASQDDSLRLVEAENTELKTRCDLLRRELQRQREAVHRERAQQVDSSGGESPASPSTESASAVQSALRAAAGGITERDLASFVGRPDSQGGPMRSSKAKLEQLMKQNEELRRENAHNNSVIAQQIRALESYKANERVQIGIEYLRNIMHQYLCAADDLRPKMIPAICTVLEFNSTQKGDVQAANPSCPRFH
ncbi:hypothetical protein ABL78_5421 [Leptomonas seymouri]|uniref:GRIP domain-containing protein n=1 Tax=Leptomonas seymouri TaxID=5684 RepID=A0A0N1IJB4_LEPSE|nr:hypothetical protein ABL78_5421 [Leptomonas seymouri]|eukprot:KPI85540.1 hypothetical protein ABL78_5421 [Leptomonas seymouri]